MAVMAPNAECGANALIYTYPLYDISFVREKGKGFV